MNKIYFIIPLLFLWVLCACNDDDEVQLSGNPVRISGLISGMNADDASTRFRGGAGVGMFMVNYLEANTTEAVELASAQVRNEKYMQSADGLVGDKRVYWGNTVQMDVVAYYPWQQGLENAPKTAFFEVAERQDTLKNDRPAYEESDFLWAQTRANLNTDPVLLTFEHLMSKVVIYLKSDAFVPGDMVGSKVSIQGTRTSARIDLTTGTVTPDGVTGNITAVEEVMSKPGYELAVKAIVVPQTVQRNTQLLEIQTLGGYSYFYDLPQDLTFEAGKQLTLEVTIESGECHVTIGDITDWTETSTPVIGEATEDLPVFKVFDLYNLNGILGMVVSVDETGKHGKVMSLDEETYTVWCTNITLNDETDADDGMLNLETILAIDPTLEDYPPMKWCMDKNINGVSGWYLPASNEIATVLKLYIEDMDMFNAKIQAIGGTPIELAGEWMEVYFWSSTLNMSARVRVPKYDMYFGYRVSLRSQSGDGTETSVRAFYKF